MKKFILCISVSVSFPFAPIKTAQKINTFSHFSIPIPSTLNGHEISPLTSLLPNDNKEKKQPRFNHNYIIGLVATRALPLITTAIYGNINHPATIAGLCLTSYGIFRDDEEGGEQKVMNNAIKILTTAAIGAIMHTLDTPKKLKTSFCFCVALGNGAIGAHYIYKDICKKPVNV